VVRVNRDKLPEGWTEFSGNPTLESLDRQQEIEMFHSKDRNRFLEHSIDFAIFYASRSNSNEFFDIDTLVSEAQAGLLEAYASFDPSEGRFTTWAGSKIRSRFYSLFRIGADIPEVDLDWKNRRGNSNLVPLDRVSPLHSGHIQMHSYRRADWPDDKDTVFLDKKVLQPDELLEAERERLEIQGMVRDGLELLTPGEYLTLASRVDSLKEPQQARNPRNNELALAREVSPQMISLYEKGALKALRENQSIVEAYELMREAA
jgi:hypothetical protein